MAPFGFGVSLVYPECMNDLIGSDTVYAVSALIANAVLRSVFGVVFPVILIWMYGRVDILDPEYTGFNVVDIYAFPFVLWCGAVVGGKYVCG